VVLGDTILTLHLEATAGKLGRGKREPTRQQKNNHERNRQRNSTGRKVFSLHVQFCKIRPEGGQTGSVYAVIGQNRDVTFGVDGSV